MNRNTRIKLHDTGMASIIKMAEGNPGATVVMAECLTKGAEIDPDSMLGGMGLILSFDTHGIYGSRIWMFYKDVCGQDMRVMSAVLRACQLGFLPERDMLHAIDNCGAGLDIPALVAQVENRLPNFQRAKAVETPAEEPLMSHTDFLNSQS